MGENLSRFIRPLVARDRDEAHRAATSLELLFDLVFVIAIAAAAHGLEYQILHGHAREGIIKFLLAFFAIWWPWNLFAWFASSFDNSDVAYRIKVMFMMVGAMFIAASMPGFFKNEGLVFTFIGYVILRMAFTTLWFRAWRDNPKHRITAKRYAIGQLLAQVYWAAVVFLPAARIDTSSDRDLPPGAKQPLWSVGSTTVGPRGGQKQTSSTDVRKAVRRLHPRNRAATASPRATLWPW